MPPEWAKIRGAVRFLDQVEVSGMQIGISRRRHPVRPDTLAAYAARACISGARISNLSFYAPIRTRGNSLLFSSPARRLMVSSIGAQQRTSACMCLCACARGVCVCVRVCACVYVAQVCERTNDVA